MAPRTARYGAFAPIIARRVALYRFSAGRLPVPCLAGDVRIDGVSERRHRKTQTPGLLYRGCTARARRGISWSKERRVAEKFADYWFDNGQAEKRGMCQGSSRSQIRARFNRGKLEKISLPDGTEFEPPVQSEGVHYRRTGDPDSHGRERERPTGPARKRDWPPGRQGHGRGQENAVMAKFPGMPTP
jgi:hypothetical protein